MAGTNYSEIDRIIYGGAIEDFSDAELIELALAVLDQAGVTADVQLRVSALVARERLTSDLADP